MDFDISDYLPALGITLAGTGASYLSNRQQQKRRQSLINQMQQYQAPRAAENVAATQNYINANAAPQQIAERTAIEAKLREGMNDSVGAVQAYETPSASAGKVTDRYTRTNAARNTDLQKRLAEAMKNLATINAPGERDRANASRFNTAATTVSANNAANDNVGRAYMSGVQGAGTNRMLDFTSDFLRGIAPAFLKKQPFGKIGAKPHAQNLGYVPDALPQE